MIGFYVRNALLNKSTNDNMESVYSLWTISALLFTIIIFLAFRLLRLEEEVKELKKRLELWERIKDYDLISKNL